mmetsp:Transcript_24742/g.33101  ORF Transcript_24742/g.33101 Transcript_24742/m.33101 type:complete len:96 (+) Transcript_24742:529-816(+)|eukprot:CAMPEP_0185589454 /NCGR_PEP_ID=MMETSP0434-20130131/57201_1 /TAXON_ID=626734 ORGANISM="Favella taraikaensis, Strain Fe Narragansett Bay" /NCGR_SAMPLE_ID=MMETSP0434 /ASSEMBLY_ACC=CAM_ASM_000379 /LENGTH=95 /DNA_ID=CAMNT_0028212869 /DNA_START=416 /DNA_END=703 /DNA_ORIENTATION=+
MQLRLLFVKLDVVDPVGQHRDEGLVTLFNGPGLPQGHVAVHEDAQDYHHPLEVVDVVQTHDQSARFPPGLFILIILVSQQLAVADDEADGGKKEN